MLLVLVLLLVLLVLVLLVLVLVLLLADPRIFGLRVGKMPKTPICRP
jgi:hypothetical protein